MYTSVPTNSSSLESAVIVTVVPTCPAVLVTPAIAGEVLGDVAVNRLVRLTAAIPLDDPLLEIAVMFLTTVADLNVNISDAVFVAFVNVCVSLTAVGPTPIR